MAFSLHEPTGQEVGVDVDDVAIVLALLHLLTQDLAADSPVLGVTERVSAKLRDDLASLQPTVRPIGPVRLPPPR